MNVGAGAIFEMSRILMHFTKRCVEKNISPLILALCWEELLWSMTNKPVVEKFLKTNAVAQTAVVNGGLRFISEAQKENARAKMRYS